MHEGDPLYFNPTLRKLYARMKRLRKDQKRKPRYKEAKRKFRKALKKARSKFLKGVLDKNRYENTRKWHSEMQKVMANGCKRTFDDLPEVPSMAGKTDREKADIYASYLEGITKDYKAISREEMHLRYAGGESLELLTVEEVAAALKAMKVPRGLHDNDAPRGLLQMCPEVFAAPLTIIYNECLQQGDWPREWKEERTTPLTKRKPALSCNDYRPISITLFFSKCLESILKERILEDIDGKMDARQFGGMKGLSSDSYFSTLFQDILHIADKGHASVLICLDMAKAFNTMTHEKVLEAAAELGVRPALLRTLAGYLHDRRTTVKWGEHISSERAAKAGCGQGTILSVLLFCITMDILLKKLSKTIQDNEGSMTEENVTSSCRCFIDDVSILIPILNPEKYEDQELDGRVFEDEGTIKLYLKTITDFCSEYGLSLNTEKTNSISFDFAQRELHFFPGSITFPNGDVVEVGETLTLLGIPLDRNLTFKTFTKERRRKGLFSLWKLRRLQANGVSQEDMRKAYSSYVRSILEYSLVPCYNLLNDQQKRDIETVQRRATKTMLGIKQLFGSEVPDYEIRLKELDLKSIEDRVQERLEKFAFKSEFSDWCKQYFQIKPGDSIGGRRPTTTRPYLVPKCRTTRRQNGPIFKMLEYLNGLQVRPEVRLLTVVQ